ncbi:MAG: PaaI family thioesterase [Rhodospirillales bacterium]|nr:PaaI family thioesterase [Rhodospirillales bacterium]
MTFDLATARSVLAAKFAPWIVELGIDVAEIDRGGAAVLRMPAGAKIARDGGVVCGQASMALADTAMVFAISAASGGYRPMTTVSQISTFIRPLAGAEVFARARLLKLGRTLAFGEVILAAEIGGEPAVQVSSTYAILGPVA